MLTVASSPATMGYHVFPPSVVRQTPERPATKTVPGCFGSIWRFAAAKWDAPGQYCLRAASSHHGPPVPPILLRTAEVVMAGDQVAPLSMDLYAEVALTAFWLPTYSSEDWAPVESPPIEI